MSAYGFARLVFDLAAGAVIDRFGDRWVAVSGLTLIALGSALTGVAPGFELAVAAWAAAGIGSALALGALYARLLRVVPSDRLARALGIYYGAFNAGVVAGGAASGLVAARLGLAGPLLVNAVLVGVAGGLWLLLAGGGRPTAPTTASGNQAEPSGRPPSTTRLLRVPGLLPVLATNFAYLWMVAVVFDTLVPLFGHDALGMSTAGIGVVFAIALATEFAVLYPAGSAADRRGRKPVLAPALAGLAVMTAAVGWATAPWLLLVLMAVLGVMSGTAGIPPGAMLSDLAPSDRQGTAVGLFRFCGDLGFTLGPLLAGWAVPALGFRWTFTLLAGPTVGALVLILRAPETLRPAAPG